MRFVPVKSAEQQGILMAHRTRALVVRQRTMAANALRAHLAEFGLVANPGVHNLLRLAETALQDDDAAVPDCARIALTILVRRLVELEEEIRVLDRTLRDWHAENEVSRRLAAIPGVGLVTATAITATVSDPGQFRSGRQFAAWLGLVPQQHSSGDKVRTGRISKQGDRYLRRLLVVGATAVIRHSGEGDPARRLGSQTSGAKTPAARLGRPRQQDGAGRLVAADARRDLPTSHHRATLTRL